MTVARLLALTVFWHCSCAQDRPAPVIEYARCFGPQSVGNVSGRNKLDDYEIMLRIVDGRSLDLLKTGNPTVTLLHGAVARTGSPVVDPARTYVHGTLRLKAELGWRVYVCSVRVRGGPLDGAIIALCDGDLPPQIRDPYQAFYPLPEGASIPPGPLAYEVVAFWSK